jgi:hypothetical protein
MKKNLTPEEQKLKDACIESLNRIGGEGHPEFAEVIKATMEIDGGIDAILALRDLGGDDVARQFYNTVAVDGKRRGMSVEEIAVTARNAVNHAIAQFAIGMAEIVKATAKESTAGNKIGFDVSAMQNMKES